MKLRSGSRSGRRAVPFSCVRLKEGSSRLRKKVGRRFFPVLHPRSGERSFYGSAERLPPLSQSPTVSVRPQSTKLTQTRSRVDRLRNDSRSASKPRYPILNSGSSTFSVGMPLATERQGPFDREMATVNFRGAHAPRVWRSAPSPIAVARAAFPGCRGRFRRAQPAWAALLTRKAPPLPEAQLRPVHRRGADECTRGPRAPQKNSEAAIRLNARPPCHREHRGTSVYRVTPRGPVGRP